MTQPNLGTGWRHAKYTLVPGAKGTVVEYDWYDQKFRYNITFDFAKTETYYINEPLLEKDQTIHLCTKCHGTGKE